MNPRRLYRSRRDRQLAGVAGGMAEYLEVDPTVVRLVWILSIFLGGFGILLYIIMAFIVPLDPRGMPGSGGGSWQTPGPSGTSPDGGGADAGVRTRRHGDLDVDGAGRHGDTVLGGAGPAVRRPRRPRGPHHRRDAHRVRRDRPGQHPPARLGAGRGPRACVPGGPGHRPPGGLRPPNDLHAVIGAPFVVLGLLLVLSALVGARVRERDRGAVGAFLLSPLHPATWYASLAIFLGFWVELFAFGLAVAAFSSGVSLLVRRDWLRGDRPHRRGLPPGGARRTTAGPARRSAAPPAPPVPPLRHRDPRPGPRRVRRHQPLARRGLCPRRVPAHRPRVRRHRGPVERLPRPAVAAAAPRDGGPADAGFGAGGARVAGGDRHRRRARRPGPAARRRDRVAGPHDAPSCGRRRPALRVGAAGARAARRDARGQPQGGHRRGGDRAAPDRAGPPRRRPAAAGDADDRPRHGRREDRGGPGGARGRWSSRRRTRRGWRSPSCATSCAGSPRRSCWTAAWCRPSARSPPAPLFRRRSRAPCRRASACRMPPSGPPTSSWPSRWPTWPSTRRRRAARCGSGPRSAGSSSRPGTTAPAAPGSCPAAGWPGWRAESRRSTARSPWRARRAGRRPCGPSSR